MNDIIYGIYPICALLQSAPQRFLEVFIVKEPHNPRLKALLTEIQGHGLACHKVNSQWLDKQLAGAVHQGIMARITPIRQYQEQDLSAILPGKNPFLLVLDNIVDPHNLGACLRSADAAGVHAIIAPRDRCAPLNATAKKVASGAAENVPLIRVTNLARTLRFLQQENILIIGTAMEESAPLFYQQDMTGPIALVMGGGGHRYEALNS